MAKQRQAWYIANNLRMERTLQRVSQQELAAKIDVSRQTISRIERLHHEPLISVAIAIAEALHKPVEDIFKVKPYPAAPWRADPWQGTANGRRYWQRLLKP